MTTDMDMRLREYAARWRAAQGAETTESTTAVQATLSALAKSPQRRRGRRATLAVAASVAAIGAIAAGTVVVTQLHRGSSVAVPGPSTPPGPSISTHTVRAIVPWNSAGVRADTAVASQPAKIGAANGLRRCSDADFSLVSGRTQSAASDDGWLRTSFVLRSVAATPCAVPNGYVDVALVTSTGATLPVDAFPSGPAVFPSMLAVGPGQLVSGTAGWAVYQGRAPRPAQLVINPSGELNATSDLRVPLGSVAIPAHPRDPSNQGPWRSTVIGSIEAVADAGTLASLTATVTAPATITNGDVLRYTVALANPTDTAVTLAGCPDFVERLDVIPLKTATTVGFRGPLNCALAPKIVGAGQTVSFRFELATAGEIPGPGRLTWQLLAENSAAVTVTAELRVQP